MANPAGYSYEAFRAAIAERDGWSCFVHRVLVARREAVIERWRTEASDVSVDHCAGWVPTGLPNCDGELDGHHLLSKSWLKREFPHGIVRPAPVVKDEHDLPEWMPARSDGAATFAVGPGNAIIWPELGTWRRLAALLNDPRNGIIACRRHHDLIEGPTEAVKLRRADLPPCAEEFAAELGTKAVARLERNFGLRPSVGERTGG